ncbi:MAG: pyridoxal-phosphate dependent enzyme [Phycisphaerae bacterium]
MNEVRFDPETVIERAARRCRERGIVIPTFAQLKDPDTAPAEIRERLRHVGLWDVDPANLFRITWKNEPVARGGGFNRGNWMEFPPALTGVPARIIGLVGKHFPTGAHKVGAAFGCLVPRLVSGQFDPTTQKAVWPSTGNYCRGGAYDCALLGCAAVAILPEGMSRERFDWLRSIGAEVIATPGSESNVKEIYDKCWEIRRTRPECEIFNQFEEFGNAVWHYQVTGGAIEEVFAAIARGSASVSPAIPPSRMVAALAEERSRTVAARTLRLAAYVSATGSAGTIAAGDFLKTRHPDVKIVAAEALQCPTLLRCGFGEHRIEGIGDKHVPWIHNVRNTDMVAAIDDEQCVSLVRLFNEDAGRRELERRGVPRTVVDRLPDIGISSICNLVAAIKTSRYYELDGREAVFVPLTDSMELYASRLEEYRRERGPYSAVDATAQFARYCEGISTDHLRELTYADRKSLHNFKYFTWVEQQGRTSDELRRLWDRDFWSEMYAQVDEWDRRIEEFNRRVAG